MNNGNMEIMDYLTSKPEVVWLLAIMGAVCVIGVVDFIKCWIKGKKTVKWIVFFVSLFIAVILSPITHPAVTTVIILWLLILALSTIARNAIVDGLPVLISKAMGNQNKQGVQ